MPVPQTVLTSRRSAIQPGGKIRIEQWTETPVAAEKWLVMASGGGGGGCLYVRVVVGYVT